MKHLIASAACALALCGAAQAQQPTLVEIDDSSDPCSRFRMRVLMPAGRAERKPRAQGTAPAVDTGMVWNPCQVVELQLALIPEGPLPPAVEQFLRARAARLAGPTGVKEKSNPPRRPQ
jgi:hypothetical protein